MDKQMENRPNWILMISMSPIAIFVVILIALVNLLQFLFKASLLFIIVAINTPFAVMYNVSILVFEYYSVRFRKTSAHFWKSSTCLPKLSACFPKSSVRWNWSDPRASVGIEIQTIVSDFFKVVAGELLVVVSAGIITFYTAPLRVFYISTAISIVAIIHKWLNTDCLSKIALSCLCGGYGLNPMMFLCSFIGFFDIGCHPVAKCSFVASRAFLFVKDGSNTQFIEEDDQNQDHARNPFTRMIHHREEKEKKFLQKVGHYRFKGKPMYLAVDSKPAFIKFFEWNAFERGLFQLNPRIDFIKIEDEKYILKSFMVLRLFDKKNLCEYPVERLELSEDYSKANELYNFLVTLSSNEGFVTDKMRGRYQHSLKLSEIVEGVEENVGYNIVDPKEVIFVVAGCTN